MENPVGSLAQRPYMKRWVRSETVVEQVVDSCAYAHWYSQPTNICTNMRCRAMEGRSVWPQVLGEQGFRFPPHRNTLSLPYL